MWSIQERALKAIVIFVIIFLVCNPSSLGLSNHELSDLNFNASSSFSPFAPRGCTRTHPGLTKGTLAKNSSRLVSTPTQSLLQAWLLRETLITIGGFIVTISSTALMVFRGRFTRLHHIPDHERWDSVICMHTWYETAIYAYYFSEALIVFPVCRTQ